MSRLTSEIEKRKRNIENEFLSAVSTLPNIEEMEQELLQLQQELQQVEELANVEVNSSFVFKVFKRREYNEQMEHKVQAKQEVRKLRRKIDQLKFEIRNTKARIEDLEQEKDEAMKRYECSEGRLIEICISEDPELLKDGEFLKSCIDVDLANICLVGDIDAGVAVLRVPKEIVDEKQGYIGWKLGFDGTYEREELYMLPEYVVGYTSYGKFIKNPIPLEKRIGDRKDVFYKITTDAHRTNIDSHRTR